MKKLISKRIYLLLIVILAISASSCEQATAQNELKAEAFKQKLESTGDEILLDVRTPGEYSEGHLQDALNIDWNGDAFETEAAKLDMSKPVFVYCLAGSRSAAAAEKMREMGFKQVYELKGGILKWRAAGLPEAGANTSSHKGMTAKAFEAKLNTDKIVLVDFYATWCGPCKKMEPFLAEIAKEKIATVTVVRIDADANSQLANELKVDKLPAIFIYNKQQLVWNHVGFVSKEEIVNKLNSIK
jgi:thioredoxin